MLGSFALPTALFEQIVSWRRHLHAHPELSGEEKETAKFVADKLKSFGLEVQTGVGGYGVVGLLSGLEPKSRCVALRADMDALPIEEKNICEYASTNRGVMHACGHDFHTANLLGVASLLSQKKTEWKGTIKFIFQPSEERVPSGAKAMIDEGVLSIPPLPSAIAGLHVSPEIETGKIGSCPGA
ncbi:MAG: amidohydrolase, partial [Chitinophagales bacterium]|nr:amidohydrolase [Chitinophagales bacterium]